MDSPQRQIPPERKRLYYIGMALIGIGFLLFLSTFVTFLGNFNDVGGQAQSIGFRALGGIVMMIAGGALMNIGAKGWSGSGVVLDPEQARKDIEPWSRMGGGVAQDALSEIEVVKKLEDHLDAPPPQVKVRCRKCQALNDESAKFCSQCGAPI